MMGDEKENKPKHELAVGAFAAKTVKFDWLQFENNRERRLLGIEVEFTEGPNMGLHGTCIISTDSLEFFHNAIIACGWTEGMAPKKIPPGVAVQAVVAMDTNPNTNVSRPIVKYINSIHGRKSALVEKYGVSPQQSDEWDKQFLISSAAFIKQTGFSVPKAESKPTQQPAQQTTQQAGQSPQKGDDIPF